MPVFQYTAAGNVQGSVTADSPRHARRELRRQGISVEGLSEQTVQTKRRFGRRASSTAKLTAATRELSTLLSAGIGLVEALDVLTKQHRGSFQTSLQLLRDEVAGGSSLAGAMREQPHAFEELTIQMVDVGENSGTGDDRPRAARGLQRPLATVQGPRLHRSFVSGHCRRDQHRREHLPDDGRPADAPRKKLLPEQHLRESA